MGSNYELIDKLESWIEDQRLVINNLDRPIVKEYAKKMPGVPMMYSEPYDKNTNIMLNGNNVYNQVQDIYIVIETMINQIIGKDESKVRKEIRIIELLLAALQTMISGV